MASGLHHSLLDILDFLRSIFRVADEVVLTDPQSYATWEHWARVAGLLVNDLTLLTNGLLILFFR